MLEIERLTSEITTAVDAELAAKSAERETKTITVTKEVIKYVESGHNQCVIDSEWVRIADATSESPLAFEKKVDEGEKDRVGGDSVGD